jgi:hypothetical protein
MEETLSAEHCSGKYQEKWLQHLERIDRIEIPKQTLKYKPKGRRNVGRPKKNGSTDLTLGVKEQALLITLQSF